MAFFNTDAESVVRDFESDARSGLSPEQVKRNAERYGTNEFTRTKPKSLFRRIFEAATEPMLILLIFAWIITMAVNIVREVQNPGTGDFFEVIGIVFAIAVSVVLTVVMEGRSAKAFAELNKIKEGIEIKVVRGGVYSTFPNRRSSPAISSMWKRATRSPRTAGFWKANPFCATNPRLRARACPWKRTRTRYSNRKTYPLRSG